MDPPRSPADPRRIVVIGPCASGKTSLTARLQRLGYDAHACGQEHSDIPGLWRHLAPDVVIGLRIELDTLRRRRAPGWSGEIYARQIGRLRSAYAHAHLVVDADTIDQDTVLAEVVGWLQDHPATPATA